jgi:hypothetical protein
MHHESDPAAARTEPEGEPEGFARVCGGGEFDEA